jgi:glycosyltransferase involved in cell wall biosynthesis
LKIIHVVSALTKGGAERVVVELANQGVLNGHTVTIIASNYYDKTILQNFLSPRVEVIFISKSWIRAYISIPFFIFVKRKLLYKADILHCHLSFGSLFGAIAFFLKKIVSFSSKVKIVETNHSVGMKLPKKNILIARFLGLFKNGYVLMANDVYWENTYKKGKPIVEVIPNGIKELLPITSPQHKQATLDSFNLPKRYKYLIGTVGMLRPDRQPILYIKLVKKIVDTIGDDIMFIMGGSGTEEQILKTEIERLSLQKNITMIGLVSNPVNLMSVLDVYVSLSVQSNVGISMIEAAMCKTCVVGYQLNDLYTTNDLDWVWSSNDLDLLAAKIIHLLKNDSERREMISKQNNYVFNNLTVQKCSIAMNIFIRKYVQNRV